MLYTYLGRFLERKTHPKYVHTSGTALGRKFGQNGRNFEIQIVFYVPVVCTYWVRPFRHKSAWPSL